ncbi:hypothetical protein Vretimale_12623, partial [Volvox reticuliferus]
RQSSFLYLSIFPFSTAAASYAPYACMCVCVCVWLCVCSDDGFGNTEANVVCRELGYASGEGVQMWGGGTGPILMDNIYCAAIYPPPNRLYQCSFNGWGIHDCSHSEDVGVRCYGTAISPPTPRPSPSPLPPTPLYGLRLVGGNSSSEGRVEIFNGTVWGTVCDDGFGNTEANVVCRELGYASGEGVQMWGGGTGPILMDNVYCSIYPSPSRLYQCSFNGWGIHDCSHSEDVGVRCYGTAISPPTPRPSPSPLPPTPLYGLRLVGGNSSSEGRVEIFNGTVWG